MKQTKDTFGSISFNSQSSLLYCSPLVMRIIATAVSVHRFFALLQTEVEKRVSALSPCDMLLDQYLFWLLEMSGGISKCVLLILLSDNWTQGKTNSKWHDLYNNAATTNSESKKTLNRYLAKWDCRPDSPTTSFMTPCLLHYKPKLSHQNSQSGITKARRYSKDRVGVGLWLPKETEGFRGFLWSSTLC